MADIKFILKQYMKHFLQGIVLPFVYFVSKKKNIDESLCILADSNCKETPESMKLVKSELENRGYKVLEMYEDFSKCSVFKMIKYMVKFMRAYANCRAVFICNYFVPCTACNKRKETKVIQLWHSCGGFKKFGYDSEEDISKYYKGNVTKNFDLITVSSKDCRKVFRSAFRLGKNSDIVRSLGVSRTDMLFKKGYAKECRQEFFEKYPECKGKKIILYAPTFRGNASECYCVGEEYIRDLQKKLGENVKVIIKMHPRMNSDMNNCDIETNRLFPVADMVITDYSSLVFEYALYKKPIVLFVPDIDEYKRGFYLDFDKDMPFVKVYKGEKLYDEVIKCFGDFKPVGYNKFLNKFMSLIDGRSTERIINEVLGVEKNRRSSKEKV